MVNPEIVLLAHPIGPHHSDAVPIAEYGGGSGKIHSFSCVGDETHLGNCSGDMDITYCGHSEDAGAMCSDFG